jgi:hypothetical protein
MRTLKLFLAAALVAGTTGYAVARDEAPDQVKGQDTTFGQSSGAFMGLTTPGGEVSALAEPSPSEHEADDRE